MTLIDVHLQDAAGHSRSLRVATGHSLMQAAVAAGVEGIAADCGGCLSCATCHVIVGPPWAAALPPPVADELAMLEMTAAPREPGSRLACQITLQPGLDGLRVRLPATQY
jgi:ferredoxin, 2Fe-2S